MSYSAAPTSLVQHGVDEVTENGLGRGVRGWNRKIRELLDVDFGYNCNSLQGTRASE